MITHEITNCNQKTALLRVQDESLWVSCRSIMDNLAQAYQMATATQEFFLYSNTSTFEVIENIIRSNVKVIAFIDHRIRLMELLSSQKFVNYIKENKVKVLVHTFGCFIDRLLEYYEAGKILSGQDLILIGSSPKHTKMIQKVLLGQSSSFVPFPVDTDQFKFNSQLRETTRKELDLSADTFLFIYTGRISCLKNVELSMKVLAKKRKEGKKIKFLTIASYDSYEPLMGQSFIGQMEQINASVRKQLDPHNEWCPHKNFIPQAELPAYLSAADAYISLSTFRGEDYGMSVAEAKSSGLPCFLTDWGGHSCFKIIKGTKCSKVEFVNNDILIDIGPLDSDLSQFEKISSAQREDISLDTKNNIGVLAVSKIINKLINQEAIEFIGLNSKLVARRQMITSSGFGIMNELRELYEEYAG